jgi:hypothetical protein
MPAVRIRLAAACAFTMLAACSLTVSLLLLQPPRANYLQWAAVAAAIVAIGLLTLVALIAPPSLPRRFAAAAGGVVLAALGAWSAYRALSSDHFEGYALVLGTALAVQGLLTALWAAGSRQRADCNRDPGFVSRGR